MGSQPRPHGRPSGKDRLQEGHTGALCRERGLKRLGWKKWQRHVEEVVERLTAALKPDDVVLGGGNARKLKPLPPGTRLGDNAFAFRGGFRLWEPGADGPRPSAAASNKFVRPRVSGPKSEDVP